ncbi:NAD(+) synthase [Flavobacterium gawalongense]|uniref:NH(3)-dependent NAD(+) synthetase n=1 Tax=Flavobacterium gawalongense TaxID=2594432 RepID=A0A553BP15_9FLAO|nr:NAD(+) synthase [Flavobacterium gawalongense]TRW99957.1 NAD(+) synthase [Flavobacterium gawalongense]TRX04418.1 NAD(+) synthase [Flavobacterium gawalongense]TRX08236.1 NAD(+) synthase [Flavobacterium gawalongense]TRX09971.1 NAD(+) synthase [Flavobacterium gawalongense]TRX24349.1 NAD(+) synthase [Flavobacterium gawalongense]
MTKKSTIQVEKVNTHIVNWLKTYAENAKVNGFVIGISGGVDSAVTSTLCAQTGLQVLCVEMPIHQPHSHVTRGREHIEQLKNRFPNVTSVEADLTYVFESFKKIVPENVDTHKLHLTQANTRARLRMTTLYYFAGIYGLLVAGTGNKVEDFGVGFYTKYGDGGVDLSPIADLLKSEVYSLGAYLEVPDSILKASPSDGLFGDERTDEDQLGASYDELEWAMNEDQAGKSANDFTGREKVIFEIYKRLNTTNKHKMNAIPVCLI